MQCRTSILVVSTERVKPPFNAVVLLMTFLQALNRRLGPHTGSMASHRGIASSSSGSASGSSSSGRSSGHVSSRVQSRLGTVEEDMEVPGLDAPGTADQEGDSVAEAIDDVGRMSLTMDYMEESDDSADRDAAAVVAAVVDAVLNDNFSSEESVTNIDLSNVPLVPPQPNRPAIKPNPDLETNSVSSPDLQTRMPHLFRPRRKPGIKHLLSSGYVMC